VAGSGASEDCSAEEFVFASGGSEVNDLPVDYN
jgi:hypothetical protein